MDPDFTNMLAYPDCVNQVNEPIKGFGLFDLRFFYGQMTLRKNGSVFFIRHTIYYFSCSSALLHLTS